MTDLLPIVDVLIIMLSSLTIFNFIDSAASFTPGPLRKLVSAGAIVVGLMVCGELLQQAGQVMGSDVFLFLQYAGYALSLASFFIFALVMYGAWQFGKIYGFKESPFARHIRSPDEKP